MAPQWAVLSFDSFSAATFALILSLSIRESLCLAGIFIFFSDIWNTFKDAYIAVPLGCLSVCLEVSSS